MDTTTNRPGGTSEVGATRLPTSKMKPSERPFPAQPEMAGVSVEWIKSIIDYLAVESSANKEPSLYLTDLIRSSHHLVYALEEQFEFLGLEALGKTVERPLKNKPRPPRLAPFPSLSALLQMDKEEQERRLDKRASELMREIEGLAFGGYYEAPEYRNEEEVIKLARRRFRKLRDTAMKLGHWTDNCWNAGKEETHLV